MNLEQPAIIVGMGEMGGSFARGLLRLGHPVFPVLRTTDAERVATEVTAPVATLVTVGEADLDEALANLPQQWRDGVVLVQNELLPRTWKAHGYTAPTVAVVWFEKKPGRPENVIIPTPVFGRHAALLSAALDQIGVPAVELENDEQLLFELVRKNLYILTANIAGLVSKGTVEDLWYNHRGLARAVADEIVPIQEWLTGQSFDKEALLAGMVEAFDADPDHGATGRSAPARLSRALRHAAEAGIEVPQLQEIQAGLSPAS